jgi:large subunit ribosomal protein L25
VRADEKLTVTVPIHLLGTAAGVKLGGIMEQTMREIELDCLPNAIPDSIEIDVSAMELGDALHVSDLTIPAGCEKSVEDSITVAHVVAPKLPTEEEEAAEAAAAEAAAEGEEPKAAADGDAKGGSDSEN